MIVIPLKRRLPWARVRERGPLLLIILFALLLPIANPRVYATDEVQYYVYLRSLRFDGDLDFANDYQEFARRNPESGIQSSLLQPDRIRERTGLYGNVAPVGSALMWSPFFLLADALVHLGRAGGATVPADGYSWPYIYAVCYASALYGLFGVLLCFRLARSYASAFAATLASATVWLATPLVFYMFIQMPFSHATGFFLVALFLTIWQRTRGARSWRAWAALGVVGALMTMTREQLGLFLLVPAVEALLGYVQLLRGRTGFGALWALLQRHALFAGVFLVSLAPQLAVYQVINGAPMPAGEVSGKLSWCSPHLVDTLVDFDPSPSLFCPLPGDPSSKFPPFAHGAFVWSPVLVPALLGLAWLWRRDRTLAAMLALAFLAQTYINGAFGTTWHLTAAFGFRRLIECTPVFVLGLAMLIDQLSLRLSRRWLVVAALVFVAWNVALVANWTVLHPVLRKGLVWPDLWRWQLEAPLEIVNKLYVLVFDRCQVLKNGC